VHQEVRGSWYLDKITRQWPKPFWNASSWREERRKRCAWLQGAFHAGRCVGVGAGRAPSRTTAPAMAWAIAYRQPSCSPAKSLHLSLRPQ